MRTGFLLAEDEAIKARFSGLYAVTDTHLTLQTIVSV